MAADAFNSIGGYTVGIPPVPVIDASGNITSDTIRTDHLLYSNGTPYVVSAAGSNTQVQFNIAGVFGASPSFTFDSSVNLLAVTNFTGTGNINLGDVSNITITGGVNGYVLGTDGLGNLSWVSGGSGGGTSGFSGFSGSAGASGYSGATGPAGTSGYSGATGTNGTSGYSGATGTNGTSGYSGVNGASGYSGIPGASGYSGSSGTSGYSGITVTPGGSNTQVQFNNVGVFGGNPRLTFNNVTNTLNVAGNLVANSLQMGSGVYHFCTSTVYFASTTNMTPDQVLWSVPSTSVSAVDFTIVANDTIGNTRQTSKISSTVLGDQVIFNEYAGLNINGGVGTFNVGYFPGDIVTPPSIQLLVSPDSVNQTTYDMMIVEYAVR